MPVEPYRTSVHGSIEIDPLIAGDLGGLHAEICSIASQQLEQTMRACFALMTTSPGRPATSWTRTGTRPRACLTCLEKMDIAFDGDGNPALQMIVSPADAARVRSQLEALTPDQAAAAGRHHQQQTGAYRASRRRCRLPRHGH